MNRAYGLLEIKEMNDESRTITGVATTISPDRMGDVVDPMGAEFKLPLPLLWQHDSGQPIGHVTDAKVSKTGITVTAQIANGVSDQIDQAWSLIKSGLVRGLSIGFRGLDTEQIPNSWGVIFKSWEWLELSAVTIPANAEASIQTIKSIDAPLLAATGKEPKLSDRPVPPGVTGKTIATKPVKAKEANMSKKSIAEQISAFQDTRKAKAVRMDEIMDEAGAKGETLNAEQKEEYDTLAAELKELDEHLGRLELRHQSDVATARAVAGDSANDATRTRTVPATVKAAAKVEPGIRFARLARCKGLAAKTNSDVLRVAESLYGQRDPEIVNIVKANVSAGSTISGNWAANLVGDETSAFADFVEWLRPQTILGKFGNGGIPSLRRVPFRVPLVGQTAGGQGYWVGEGKAKPLTAFDFSRTTLEPLKVANIAVLTMEVLRDSSPSAEMIVRDQLAAALRERLDTDFISPTKTASANVSPASITNGVSAVHSAGNTADDVRQDIKALFASFIADNNAPTTGVWIMPATVALALSLMQNALGQAEFPGLTMNGGTLFGLPVIVSEYVPSVSAGAYVILANASDIYLADDGDVSVDMSTEASLEMSDAPAHNSTTPTAAQLVSLWQTNSVGFRAERTINWAKRRSGAVAVLDQVNWGAGS